MKGIAQKNFRALNRLLAPKAAAGGRLFQRVVITHNAARRVDSYVELFFLQRLEEARVPVPDVHLGSHQAIGFGEAGFTLEVGFLVVIHAEDDGGLVVFDGEALSGDEGAGLLERGLARHLEIDGRFREGLEEVTVGDARAQQCGEQPEQEHPSVLGVQAYGAGPLRGWFRQVFLRGTVLAAVKKKVRARISIYPCYCVAASTARGKCKHCASKGSILVLVAAFGSDSFWLADDLGTNSRSLAPLGMTPA